MQPFIAQPTVYPASQHTQTNMLFSIVIMLSCARSKFAELPAALGFLVGVFVGPTFPNLVAHHVGLFIFDINEHDLVAHGCHSVKQECSQAKATSVIANNSACVRLPHEPLPVRDVFAHHEVMGFPVAGDGRLLHRAK
jgi:hypothetical protein